MCDHLKHHISCRKIYIVRHLNYVRFAFCSAAFIASDFVARPFYNGFCVPLALYCDFDNVVSIGLFATQLILFAFCIDY